jgi:hypothetical protein
MCVAEKKAINTARFFRRESAMVEIIAPINPFQIWKQAELEEIENPITLAGLHELVKILVGETEAHAKIEKNSRILIFEQYLVATDFIDSSV